MNSGVNTASISRSSERSTFLWVTPARLRRWLVRDASTGSSRRRRVAGRPVVRAARPTVGRQGGAGRVGQVGRAVRATAAARLHNHKQHLQCCNSTSHGSRASQAGLRSLPNCTASIAPSPPQRT